MLVKAKTLKGYTLHSLDKDIGKVKGFYFDDHHWGVRYLIADTGHWLSERQVLLSPYVLEKVNPTEKTVSINLTRKQIEESPALECNQPVSQQFEESYISFFGLSMYWRGSFLWGDLPYIERDSKKRKEAHLNQPGWDRHLRSMSEITGYHIQAKDGEMGYVKDFILDIDTWAIRYLIIDTQNWWVGKEVLIFPEWVEAIHSKQSKVFINHLCKTIKQAPKYTDISLLTRVFEKELHQYYDSKGYWIDELASSEHSVK